MENGTLLQKGKITEDDIDPIALSYVDLLEEAAKSFASIGGFRKASTSEQFAFAEFIRSIGPRAVAETNRQWADWDPASTAVFLRCEAMKLDGEALMVREAILSFVSWAGRNRERTPDPLRSTTASQQPRSNKVSRSVAGAACRGRASSAPSASAAASTSATMSRISLPRRALTPARAVLDATAAV